MTRWFSSLRRSSTSPELADIEDAAPIDAFKGIAKQITNIIFRSWIKKASNGLGSSVPSICASFSRLPLMWSLPCAIRRRKPVLSFQAGLNAFTGAFLIQPLSESVPGALNNFALPPINGTMIIDGYTQPGASPNTLANGDNAKLLIQIDGSDHRSGDADIGLPAGNDHVLQPIQNVDVTISILVADITGAEHPITKYRVCFFQVVPIAAHYICAAGNQLTMFAGSNFLSLAVYNLDFNAGTRAPARCQSVFCVFMILQPSKKARFTEAINLDQFCSGVGQFIRDRNIRPSRVIAIGETGRLVIEARIGMETDRVFHIVDRELNYTRLGYRVEDRYLERTEELSVFVHTENGCHRFPLAFTRTRGEP